MAPTRRQRARARTGPDAKRQRALKELRTLLARRHDRRPGDAGWYYRLGRRLWALRPAGPTAYGSRWLPGLLRELGCGEEHLEAVSRAVRLARRCPQGEWDRLCAAGLGLTRIFILLRLRDGPTRQRLGKQALREKWSCSRLQAEVRRARGYCGPKGGKAALIHSFGAADDLRGLLQLTRQWLARYHRLWSPEKQKFPSRLGALRDPAHTARLARDVNEAVGLLAELGQAAEALRRGLKERTKDLGSA